MCISVDVTSVINWGHSVVLYGCSLTPLKALAVPADRAFINKSFSCGRHLEAENLFFDSQKFS